MNYEIIKKKDIPEPKPFISRKEELHNLLNQMDYDQALHLKFDCFGDMSEVRRELYALNTKFRRDEATNIIYLIIENELTAEQRKKYDSSKNPGLFKRPVSLYVYKTMYIK